MGRILHCSQRVYSNYERGDIDIPTGILIKLGDFYQVSVDYCLTGRTTRAWRNKFNRFIMKKAPVKFHRGRYCEKSGKLYSRSGPSSVQ